MKEQIKKYKSELIALVENIKKRTGANEVRIDAQSTPHLTDTRITLEFNSIKEVHIKENCHG